MVCAIPARWGSTRLPGKPLLELAGKPMIQHVYERAGEATGVDRVVVLTDDERILDAVRGFGGEAEMTPVECPSGTDRIAHAARSWSEEAIVNLQGDEPLIDPRAVSAVAEHLRELPGDAMVTLAAPLAEELRSDPARVKVVLDRRGYALYFSRAPIPHRRDAAPANASDPTGREEVAPTLLHIGIYGYRRDTLLELAALAPTPLERSEALEQLRALESGVRIRVLRSDHSAVGVDTAADVREAERLLRQRSRPAGAVPASVES
ncbi:MAG: 3-deoxy-manno-octulosonate cytidylyltransferase [Acidobacteria bacterium]|nr:MAG: 3-deoxy-manno-octulosonate cytidylyltransferase [Acidobacteriota bacterium]REK00520.1 MAG: 3-deoxy-manno-octulosonate cytidylyltransferase [Acidobacteriota bacterium]